MAFIGPDDILVTEKATGQVKRVINGVVTGVVLDLAGELQQRTRACSASRCTRTFPATPYVYLYNTESTTGADTHVAAEVPLLGNRVDRFRWNGGDLDVRPQHHPAARVPERSQQRRRSDAARCCAATTTAA